MDMKNVETTKRVLVVDDEEDMLWMLQRNLNKGMPSVEILTASSGEEALEILNEKPSNLVITDINMPGMNGLDLLLEINNHHPETGVIIMTAYPSSAYENEAMMSGSLRFIEKPFDINELRTIVEQHIDDNEGFQGTIDNIELIDIVQFNGLSRATSALKVTTPDQEGMIFFKDGEIVHAMCEQLSGEEAFFEIIGFQGGTLQNIRGVEPPVVSIDKNLESLLFEAAVHRDEKSANENIHHAETVLEDFDKDLLESTIGNITDETTGEKPLLEPGIRQVWEDPENTIESKGSGQNKPEDEELTDIQKILAEFTDIEGVHTACLVGRDGFLLDSLARQDIDAEMIGAIASSGFGSSESMGNQLGQGELHMTMLEYQNGPVMFAPVGSEAFLVIVASQETNLGWIRLTIKKIQKKSKKIERITAT